MLNRLFGNTEEAIKAPRKPLHDELINLTIRHFRSTYGISETESVFREAHVMLNELNLSDNDFDRKYDVIVFGTIVAAMVAWEGHRLNGQRYCEITETELNNLFKQSSTSTLPSIPNDSSIRSAILAAGDKVLDGLIPFKASFLTDLPLAKEYVNLQARLNVYRPEIIGDDEVLTTREKSMLHLIETLKEKNSRLQNELNSANDKIADMAPKAQLIDDEQARKLAELEQKARAKKTKFGALTFRHK